MTEFSTRECLCNTRIIIIVFDQVAVSTISVSSVPSSLRSSSFSIHAAENNSRAARKMVVVCFLKFAFENLH